MICGVEEENECLPGSAEARDDSQSATGRTNPYRPTRPKIGDLNLKQGQKDDNDLTTIRKCTEEEKIPSEKRVKRITLKI